MKKDKQKSAVREPCLLPAGWHPSLETGCSWTQKFLVITEKLHGLVLTSGLLPTCTDSWNPGCGTSVVLEQRPNISGIRREGTTWVEVLIFSVSISVDPLCSPFMLNTFTKHLLCNYCYTFMYTSMLPLSSSCLWPIYLRELKLSKMKMPFTWSQKLL